MLSSYDESVSFNNTGAIEDVGSAIETGGPCVAVFDCPMDENLTVALREFDSYRDTQLDIDIESELEMSIGTRLDVIDHHHSLVPQIHSFDMWIWMT